MYSFIQQIFVASTSEPITCQALQEYNNGQNKLLASSGLQHTNSASVKNKDKICYKLLQLLSSYDETIQTIAIGDEISLYYD